MRFWTFTKNIFFSIYSKAVRTVYFFSETILTALTYFFGEADLLIEAFEGLKPRLDLTGVEILTIYDLDTDDLALNIDDFDGEDKGLLKVGVVIPLYKSFLTDLNFWLVMFVEDCMVLLVITEIFPAFFFMTDPGLVFYLIYLSISFLAAILIAFTNFLIREFVSNGYTYSVYDLVLTIKLRKIFMR